MWIINNSLKKNKVFRFDDISYYIYSNTVEQFQRIGALNMRAYSHNYQLSHSKILILYIKFRMVLLVVTKVGWIIVV